MTPGSAARRGVDLSRLTPAKPARAAAVAARRAARGPGLRLVEGASTHVSREDEHHERLVDACARRGYELLAPIGKGGMGCVWLARQRGGDVVAIKAMLSKVADDPEFRAMFLDEGRIAARIASPHVARVLALEEDGDVLFQVMEWVDGESLLELHWASARRGERIPVPVVLHALAGACDGLHAAHELRGPDGASLCVVHRDVSPANVLVSASGGVRLVDFGIAKARARTARSTMGFALKGRVHYVAPEYALGFPIDRRADAWSMGATLYFLLCGREPFAASNEAAVLFKLTSGEPLPALPSHVPPDVAAIAYRALERDPADRYATAAEMRDALWAAAARMDRTPPRLRVAAFVAEHESSHTRERRRVAAEARRRGVSPSRGRGLGVLASIALAAGALAFVAWPGAPGAALAGSSPPSSLKEIAPSKVLRAGTPDVRVVEFPATPRRAPPPEVVAVVAEPRAPIAPPPPPAPHPPKPPPRRHYGF